MIADGRSHEPRQASRESGPATRIVEGDGGIRLAVTERGPLGAPTIILVHGYPDSQRVWTNVAELLAQRYRVVTYDVRGAGRSDAPSSHRGYALRHLARDLEAVIDAVAPPIDRGPKVHLVGHDWGSIQSWEVVTDPAVSAKVKSFTSICGPCLDHAGAWMRSATSVGDVLGQVSRSWYIAAMHAGAAVPGLWAELVGAAMPKVLQRTEGLGPDASREATRVSDAKNGVGLYVANISKLVLAPRERKTSVPVQIVAPLGDPFISVEMTRYARRFVPSLFFREVTGGHWQPLSNPERVARWIAELVNHVEGEGAGPSFERLRAAAPRKLVVVTGGASGVGRETSLLFAKDGADIVVADDDIGGAERTAELCRSLGIRARAHEVDVASEASMKELAEAVLEREGVPDVLVLNADLDVVGRFLDTSAKDWERLLGVNVLGVAHGARLFGKAMVERGQGGHVVIIASAAAFSPSKMLPAYATSKAAVLMLADCLRAEFAEARIGVSTICPGGIGEYGTTTIDAVGATSARVEGTRQNAERLHRRRGVRPDVVARAIFRAISEDRPVVPVATEAHILYFMSRFAPGVLRQIARRAPRTRH